MQVQQLEDIFMHRWGKYCSGIVEFADATKNKSKELRHALREDDSGKHESLKDVTCILCTNFLCT